MNNQRVIVIGSGPCGAMAARVLVRNGVPVTMLESGTTHPSGLLVRVSGRNVYRLSPARDSGSKDFVASGDPATRWETRLAPGGLSSAWTGAVPRFAPLDFEEGVRLDERYRWPIGYDDLQPYYANCEHLLDLTGSTVGHPVLPAGEVRYPRSLPDDWGGIGRVAAARGQALTALPLADGANWFFARRATAFDSFTNLVRPLLGSPRFDLRLGAHALRIEWSATKRGVDAVVYHDRTTGSHVRLDAAAVVVACGPLHSTKLLFDSACPDFPEGLANTDGVLGLYFHDHLKEWWSFTLDRRLSRLAPAGYLTRRPYEESTPLLATSWTIGNASPRDRLLSLLPLKAGAFGVQVFGTMVPTTENYVRPHDTARDEFGLPQLEVHIDFDGDAVKNVLSARDIFVSMMDEAGYRCSLQPVEPQLFPGNAVHYGGTVRMHRSRQYGALNEWNRPFDVPNLVVSDASCFTTNTEKNPTLTAMALSARAADRLAHDLRRG
jgi:choline dehydrogenase-like flavoprotein